MSFDHVNYQKGRIHRLLETIEDKTGKMAHEIDEVRHQLKNWQDGHLANSTFTEHLNKFVDLLNSGSH